MRLLYCVIFCWLTTTSVAQEFYPVKVNQKWGLINNKGKIVVPPTYDAIGDFYQFGYAVVQKNSKVGVMNSRGKIIIPVQYHDLQILDSTVFAVVMESRWNIIDLSGRTILEGHYERVKIWDKQYISFSKNGKWGLVHLSGKSLAPPIYDNISIENQHYFRTRKSDKHGLIRNDGRVLVSPSADAVVIHSDSLFFFKDNYQWGAVNYNGKPILQAEWDSYQVIGNNFIQVNKGKDVYLYALSADRIISRKKYDNYLYFSKNKILFKKRHKLGLMSASGKELLSGIYTEIQPYGANQYRVRKNKRWGIIDSDEKIIIPFDYEYISPLQKQVCVVRKGRKFGIANYHGKLIIQAEFDKIELKNNIARAFKGKSLTLMSFSKSGELLGKNNIGKHASIKIKKRNPTIQIKTLDGGEGDELIYILDKYEWFYSAEEDLYGLRSLETGDIQIKPTFDNVWVKKDLGFTIVSKKRFNEQKIDQTRFRFDVVYGLVNNEKGLLVTDLNLLDIRLSDFENKNLNLARCIFKNGKHGLIQKNGKVVKKDYAYIGEFINGLARASARGRLSGETSGAFNHFGKVSNYLTAMRSPHEMIDFTNHDNDFIENAHLTCAECDWGFIDTAGNTKIPEIYSFAYDFVNGIAIANKNGKWGTINSKNQTLIDFKYDDIQFLSNSNGRILRLYINQDKYGLIDTLGRAVISVSYDDVGAGNEGLIPVKKNGLWGFVNAQGKQVIPCQYERAKAFHNGLAAVRKNRKWGFINKFNNAIIPFEYKDVGNFDDDKAWFKDKYKYGYINREGAVVIPVQFDDAADFQGNVARIKIDDSWGMIDRSGTIVMKPRYNYISNFDKTGLAVAQLKSGNYTFIDKYGNRITNKRFRKVLNFHEGLAAVKKDNLWGFIDTTGQMVITPQYSQVMSFQDGRASVRFEYKWGFIDKSGKWVIQPQFSKCLSYKDGKAVVYKGLRNAGLIDLNGNYIIEPSISRMLDFNDGRGLVRDGNYRFYFITEDNRLYKGFYQNAESFRDGVAAVQKRGKWGLINDNGIELIPPKYDKVETFSDGFAKVRITQFSGVATKSGKIIATPKYEYISYAGNGIFRVEEGDKVGYFDSNGQWIWALRR